MEGELEIEAWRASPRKEREGEVMTRVKPRVTPTARGCVRQHGANLAAQAFELRIERRMHMRVGVEQPERKWSEAGTSAALHVDNRRPQ